MPPGKPANKSKQPTKKPAAKKDTAKKPAAKKVTTVKTATAKKPAKATAKRVAAKPAKTVKTAAQAPAAKLTAGEVRQLDALDGSFERGLDYPVAVVEAEAGELERAWGKYGARLVAGSRLTSKQGEALAGQRATLATAEAVWADHRTLLLSPGLRALRDEAERSKRELLAALGYFCGDDAHVAERLTAIRHGAGLPDLLQDLGQLAVLADEHAAALKKADLPQGTVAKTTARARELCAQLDAHASERAIDDEGPRAMALRNRAYWQLRATMDAIRAAGRYVFRDQPGMLKAFRSTSTNMHKRPSSAANATAATATEA